MFKFFGKVKKERYKCPIIMRLQAEGKCLKSCGYCDKQDLRDLKPLFAPCCVDNECQITVDATGERTRNYYTIVPDWELKRNLRKYYSRMYYLYIKNKIIHIIVFISGGLSCVFF